MNNKILQGGGRVLPIAIAVLFFTYCAAGGYSNTGAPLPAEGIAANSIVSTEGPGTVTGSFNILAYNVAGLPAILSSSDPVKNTGFISCLIRSYDVVHVQEDFNYHATLYDSCDNHLYRSPTSGGVPFGSGLNQLSNFPYTDFDRITWTNRVGPDALTPKGFTMARTWVAPGVAVDFYNLHAQAGQTDPFSTASWDEAALAASRSDISQLLAYINENSQGNAVIIFGDTNTRYTRAGQNMHDFLAAGFRDVWVDLVRSGLAPANQTAPLTDCSASYVSPNCEIVDKVLYRSNSFVQLAPTAYQIDDALFRNPETGQPLSDHKPLEVRWSFSTAANRTMSAQFGGPHGTNYNDADLLSGTPKAAKISLRAGSRIDSIGLTLANGTVLAHGGNGGTLRELYLGSNEYADSLQVCSGKKNNHTRIFYARFTTNLGRSLTGGTQTSECTTFAAPSGYAIVGFHGRSGNEVDKAGVIFAPVL